MWCFKICNWLFIQGKFNFVNKILVIFLNNPVCDFTFSDICIKLCNRSKNLYSVFCKYIHIWRFRSPQKFFPRMMSLIFYVCVVLYSPNIWINFNPIWSVGLIYLLQNFSFVQQLLIRGKQVRKQKISSKILIKLLSSDPRLSRIGCHLLKNAS